MRTIGFRSNILFAIAAAAGVVAALGRPWYGPSEAPTDARMEDLFKGIGRAFTESDGTTGWAALTTADSAIAGLACATAVLLVFTLVQPLQVHVQARALDGARDARGRRREADRRAGVEHAVGAAPRRLRRARRIRGAGREHHDGRRGPVAQAGAAQDLHAAAGADVRARLELWAASVLSAADAAQAVLQVGRVLDDLGEADDRDGVLERDLAVVDLLEEVDELLGAAELGVVVLDVARRELLDALHLDVVDDGVKQLLAR